MRGIIINMHIYYQFYHLYVPDSKGENYVWDNGFTAVSLDPFI